jgi:L-lactate dehydrogenase complex protein LldG
MTEKEKILARIREALAVSAPTTDSHHAPVASPRHFPLNSRPWLPLVGESFDARLALFQKNCADLKSSFHFVNSADELARSLRDLRDAESWKKIGVHAGELTNDAIKYLDLPVCRTDQAYSVTDLESCDVGITECDALVAQTGSILVTARSAGGRALSVLPPHHVVLARREQLIADLPDAFALLKRNYASNYPSFISFITGPSRTGDIERILVLGAHGPKKLTIFML